MKRTRPLGLGTHYIKGIGGSCAAAGETTVPTYSVGVSLAPILPLSLRQRGQPLLPANRSALLAGQRVRYVDTALRYHRLSIPIEMEEEMSPLLVVSCAFAMTLTWMDGSIAMAGGEETQAAQSIGIFQATPQTA